MLSRFFDEHTAQIRLAWRGTETETAAAITPSTRICQIISESYRLHPKTEPLALSRGQILMGIVNPAQSHAKERISTHAGN